MGNENSQFDVVVVGAGVIGLSSAYHIKKNDPTLSVLVLDSNTAPAQGESAKSVAAVRDCFTSEVNRLLAGSSIEFYKHVQAELGFNLHLDLISYLWLYSEFQFKQFDLIEKELRENGVRLRVWDRKEIAAMIPDLVVDPNSEQSHLIGLESVFGAVQALNCGTVSPELVARFYENEFRKLGGEFQFRTEVRSLVLAPKNRLNLPGEPHIWQEKFFSGVRTIQGTILADTVVLAAGVRTPWLLDAVGVDCLVKPKKRQVFQLRGNTLERLLNTKGLNEQDVIPFTILPKSGIHFRPVRGERSIWVAAADELGRPFKLEEEPAAEEMYYNYDVNPVLSEYFPCFAGLRPTSSWAGHYDINSLDGAPILDRVSNCVIVTGLSGSGIMKADAVGRVAAAVLEGKPEAVLFNGRAFTVSRLGLEKRNVERERFVL